MEGAKVTSLFGPPDAAAGHSPHAGRAGSFTGDAQPDSHFQFRTLCPAFRRGARFTAWRSERVSGADVEWSRPAVPARVIAV
jgi:hypothetical protein